uniref:Uncharacterized protein n=1 Tax=Chlorella sp. ArM0029B TaxID=1415603 RepID=U5U510_9CHLO|nr:hypothetical protein CH29B_m023 [Chlorella sp. ArM0029B]
MLINTSQNLQSKNSGSEFFFFFILSFLSIYCFLGSFLNCFYFLTHFQAFLVGRLFTGCLFVLSLVLYFFSPKFKYAMVGLFLLPMYQNYCLGLLSLLEKKMKKNPFAFFLFIVGFFCFSFLHVFMICVTGLDPTIEYIYQLFNAVRLFFFPLIIYCYVIRQMPSTWYSWEALLHPEKVESAVKSTYAFITESNTKYPKITKTGVFFAFGLSGILYQGSMTKTAAEELKLSTSVSYANVDERSLVESEPLRLLQAKVFQDEKELSRSIFHVGCNGIYRVFASKPTLYNQLAKDLEEASVLNKLLNGTRQLAAEKKALALSTQGSVPASSLVSQAETERVVVPSVLECILFLF